MTVKRVPSFLSSRPGFPAGLRVLLLDTPASAREAMPLLRQCNYIVTSSHSLVETLEAIGTADTPFDVLLADASLLASKSSSKQLKEALKELPTLAMTENPHPEQVLASISMGVAEVLEKPLCPLKLKNIWQHTVRRVMGPRMQRSGSKHVLGRLGAARAAGIATRLASVDTSSVSATQPALDLSPTVSHDLNNTATSCGLLSNSTSSPSSQQQASGQAGANLKQEGAADTRRGQKRKSEVVSRSNSSGEVVGTITGAAAAGAAAPQAEAPAEAATGLPASSMAPQHSRHVSGVDQAAASAGLPCSASGAPSAGCPSACPTPSGVGLPIGMVWGTPMNPNHVAPGITPPVFAAPMTPPVAMMPTMPGQAWPPCMLPGIPQAFPLPGPLMLPGAMMPGMPPMMPGMPAIMPMASPFTMPGSVAGPMAGAPLAPLPMTMLMSACSPCVMLPGTVDGPMSPCSPCLPHLSAATTMSERSTQDVLHRTANNSAALLKAKMPRCESAALLPSLEDLMCGSSAGGGGGAGRVLGSAADMDLELDTLSLAFRRNNSLDDLISHSVAAF